VQRWKIVTSSLTSAASLSPLALQQRHDRRLTSALSFNERHQNVSKTKANGWRVWTYVLSTWRHTFRWRASLVRKREANNRVLFFVARLMVRRAYSFIARDEFYL